MEFSMENRASDSVTSFSADSNRISQGKDLLLGVTVEPLHCILKTNIRVYVNDISIKNK